MAVKNISTGPTITPFIIDAGSLGASSTISFTPVRETVVTGQMAANHALTITNPTIGARMSLLFDRDITARTLTLNGTGPYTVGGTDTDSGVYKMSLLVDEDLDIIVEIASSGVAGAPGQDGQDGTVLPTMTALASTFPLSTTREAWMTGAITSNYTIAVTGPEGGALAPGMKGAIILDRDTVDRTLTISGQAFSIQNSTLVAGVWLAELRVTSALDLVIDIRGIPGPPGPSGPIGLTGPPGPTGPSAAITVVSSLPGSPTDGQEIYYIADSANGILWHFRYRSASTSAYKWEGVGDQASIVSVVSAESSTQNTSYSALLSTTGPSVTVPLTGDYIVEVSSDAYQNTLSSYYQARHSYDVGATGATDADSTCAPGINYTLFTSLSKQTNKTAIAAGTAIVSKYRTEGGGTAYFRNRQMRVRPIRVG